MIFDKFGRTEGQNTVYRALKVSEQQHAIAEINQAQKMYDYLKGDRSAILLHLRAHLGKIVNAKTLANMPLIWINYVPRIIKRLCLVYKRPAIRYIGDADTKQGDYPDLTRNLSKWSKEFHRQAKLFNTILVRPIFDKENKCFDYLILARNLADVETAQGNSRKMTHLCYQIEVERNGKKEAVKIHWTDSEHYATTLDGKQISLPDVPENGVNPYGVIPFAVIRLEEAADFWGDGMPDLVDANEALNGRLSDMFFKLYMSFGLPFGVNLGIKADDFAIGPDKPVLVDNAQNGDVPPSLQFLTPEQKTELDKVVNDWFKFEIANSKGLPASGFSQDAKYSSGFERLIDNAELIDLNEDDKEALREFELKLFELQKKELEVSGSGLKFPEGDLNIEFAEIEFPKNNDEIWSGRENEVKYNISTPLDWLRKENPTLSDGELEEIVRANKEINDRLLSKPQQAKTSLRSLLNSRQQQPDNQDAE